MKKRFIIANWKSNKTVVDAKNWLERFMNYDLRFMNDKEVVICAPFTLLPFLKSYLISHKSPLKLGVQDISPYAEGAYTGAIAARQAGEFVSYAIVGHSERRKYFHETNEEVLEKIKQLLANDIAPVLCISDIDQLEYFLKKDAVLVANAEKIIFVYEPPSAISGGGAFHAEKPEAITANATEIERMIGKTVSILYGGSVNPENAKMIFGLERIGGGLLGQASLDPEKFVQIING